jgi:hypothetical protein
VLHVYLMEGIHAFIHLFNSQLNLLSNEGLGLYREKKLSQDEKCTKILWYFQIYSRQKHVYNKHVDI